MTSKSFFGIFGRDLEERAELFYRRGNLAKAAELFARAKKHEQAAALYVDLGDVDRAVEVYREGGKAQLAGELLERMGRTRDAIAAYEEAGAYRQAAEACLTVQQYVRAGRLFEQANLYHSAAESFAKAGEVEQALRSWEHESNQLKEQRSEVPDEVVVARIRELDLHRADILAQFGRNLEAAELLAELDRPGRAAPLFERARRPVAAARAYLRAGQPDDALKTLDRHGDAFDDELRLEIYLRCGKDAEAGDLLERLGRLEEAASSFEDAGAWGKAARLWEEAELVERAASLYFRVERFEEAGRCYAAAGQHDKAGRAFARAGNHQAAGDAFLAADALLRAGEHYLEAGAAEAAQDALQRLDAGSPDFGRASMLLVPLLLDQGLAAGARHRLDVLEASAAARGVARAARYYWRGRVEEALGNLVEAEASYQKAISERSDFRDSGRRLSRLRTQLGSDDGSDAGTGAQPAAGGAAEQAAGGDPGEPDLEPDDEDETAVGERSAPSSKAAKAAPSPSVEASAGLPFAVEEELEPWWPDCTLWRIRTHRGQQPGVLLSFPLDSLGPRAASFRLETQRIQALDHPSILRLEEAILTEDRAHLRYEPFAAASVARQLAGPWRPLASSALNLLVQVCDGLAAAHQLGMVHRWLSPNTVLLDDDERLKLAGFGLHDLIVEPDATAVAYQAPELRQEVIGPAADIFSFGLLGVELLGALLPADWTESNEIDAAEVAWPAEVREVVPESIREVLIRCLGRSPLLRPSAEALKGILSTIGLVPGQVLQGRYEILGELGRGGMSRVYRARDKTLGEEVAIKTLLSPALRHTEEEKRLLREVQICRRISHPHVVRVHDLGNFPGGIFVTMELLEGTGLDEVIQNQAPLPLERVRKMATEVAQALAEAHRMEVVHRDLKPGNVMLVEGRVKVLDFGIARMGGAGSPQASMTRTGEVIGSPMYMAPEQIQGKPLDGTCDLYALGVITYTLLAGREPFLGDSPTAVVYQHLQDPPPDIHQFRADLPAAWVTVLERMLAKKPADRYPTAEALIEALGTLPV